MPPFMDIHHPDRGATVRAAMGDGADDHRADPAIQADRAGSYPGNWLSPASGRVDRLVEAPRAIAANAANHPAPGPAAEEATEVAVEVIEVIEVIEGMEP